MNAQARKHKHPMVAISVDLLTRLVDALDSSASGRERLLCAFPEDSTKRMQPGIDKDRDLVDQARKLLRPSFRSKVDSFAGWTLEELRMGREVALKNGNMERVMALATAIDIKRGFYK